MCPSRARCSTGSRTRTRPRRDRSASEGHRRSPIECLDAPPARGDRGSRRRSELLNAVVADLRHVDIAGGIRGHAVGVEELAVPTAGCAPLGQIDAGAGELLDAVVAVVDDIDATAGFFRNDTATT